MQTKGKNYSAKENHLARELLRFFLKYKYLVSKYNHIMSPTFHGLSYKELCKHN